MVGMLKENMQKVALFSGSLFLVELLELTLYSVVTDYY